MSSSWSSSTTASSQVEIHHRPVSWRFSRQEFGQTLEFYDDYHEEIVLINSEFIYKSHKQSSKLNKFNIKVPNHTSILNAKFSPQNTYIGLQLNRHELQIKTIRGEIVAIQQCRNIKSGNEILNFHWINIKDANLCIVCKNGIELYGFNASNKKMTLIKSIKYTTSYHWYLPSQQFLMLVNPNFVFYGIKLTYLKLEKINKFEIVGIDSNLLKESNLSDFYQQITLIEINNNNIGCIFIDERKTKLYLFKVIRHQMQLTHSYHLYSSGKYTIFHIDNVLVAYNKNTEMPILIDFNGNNYISAPLPITMCYYEGNDPNKPKRIFSTQKHIATNLDAAVPAHENDEQHYVKKPPPKSPPPSIKQSANKNTKIARKRYKFISPLFILEQWSEKYAVNKQRALLNGKQDNKASHVSFDSGNFYTLSLNLDAIVHSWGPERQIPLLHFLLHRETNDSKVIIIKMLYHMIKSYCLGYKYDLRSRLDFISEYFIVLNEVLRRAVEESAIIAQNHHEQQLLQQQKKQQLLTQNKSFTARFRQQSQSYAAKLFGTPPNNTGSALMSGSSAAPGNAPNILQNDHLLYRAASTMNNTSALPPPHLPARSKSAANVQESHLPDNFLPAPQHKAAPNMNDGSGRRVAATVKFDLEKTSQGETVIKTTELLEDIFNPMYQLLVHKDKQIKQQYQEQKNSQNHEYVQNDAEDKQDEDDDFKLSDGKLWSKAEINKCLDRYLAVLIEYTRTMHRIRLKLPISISMLLIRLLRYTNKLYTLHQLFQYHAFPDDEKLAMELLDIASTNSSSPDSSSPHTPYPAGKQLGIDMLLRLGRWSKICQILLQENEVETGVRLFLEKYPFDKKNNLEQIQLSDFLEKALKLDPIRFYHLYRGLDMIVSSHHSIFSYYSDYYTQTLYGGGAQDGNNDDKNKSSDKKSNEPGSGSHNAKKYGYNNNSRATNLHVLFSDEMNNFRNRFDSLHKKFYDDSDAM